MSSRQETYEDKIKDVEDHILTEVYLTNEQIEELCGMFMLPFKNLDIVLDSVNDQVKSQARMYLERVTIYEGMFEEYKEHIYKKYLISLIEAGTPIGAITSDAIGQQATQALLNTFHSVGTLKSGGPDGIKENIGISPNRKILYSIIHMKNGMLSYSDIMKMKSEFIGLPISKLLINNPESLSIDIKEELSNNPFNPAIDQKERQRIFGGNSSWWYSLSPWDGVFDPSNGLPSKRACLRLRFDIQKLFEFKLKTTQIAAFINTWKFEITIPKKKSSSSNKRETIEEYVYAVPSPTHIGIIDIFMKAFDDSKDHLLISLIHGDEFKNLKISGIDGISNFYAVSTPIIRLIRDIEETSRFDKENGINGTWVYLTDNRFTGIPYFRLLKLFDKAGLKYEIPYFNTPNSYNDMNTDLPFEFFSHKSVPELRSSMKLRAYLFANMTEHVLPSFFTIDINGAYQKIEPNNDHYKSKKIGSGFDVALYHFGIQKVVDSPLSNKKFKNRSALVRYISSFENRITKNRYKELFNDVTDEQLSFFKVEDNRYKIILFEVEDDPVGNYFAFYMFQYKYIDYEINVNLDYVNSHFVTNSLDTVLSSQFWIPYNIANQGGVSLPDSLRKYRTYDVKTIKPPERRILLKTKMFFTDKYDHLGEEHREIILEYYRKVEKDATKNEKIELIKKLCAKHEVVLSDFTIEYYNQSVYAISSDDKLPLLYSLERNFNIKLTHEEREEYIDGTKTKLLETLISGEKPKPVDRLLLFLKTHTKDEDMNYIYAETTGSNIQTMIVNQKILGNKLISNHFHQIYNTLGLEALRNGLDYDLINMINNSGYIAVEYMNLLTNVTTHNGINPMTSEGISCQRRDPLAMTTIDNAPKYLHSAALLGEKHGTQSTSTCIFLGKLFKMGTGSVNVIIDKTHIKIFNRREGISEGFLKLTGTNKIIGNLFVNQENDEPIIIPRLVSGKFPKVKWIMDNFVKKDMVFYFQQGINRIKRATLEFFKPHDASNFINCDDLLIKIKKGSTKRP